MENNEVNIEYRKVSDLVLLKENPRKISTKDLGKLVDSIRINGFWKHRPITLSDRTGEVIVLAGNQRLKAAKKLKLDTVPTIMYHDLTEEQEREVILRDNVNNGQWDFEALQGDYWGDVDFNFMGIDMPDLSEPDKKKSKKKAQADDDTDGEDGQGISRYFQECGILVYADLNVSVKFMEYNKLGIPKGYNAFFTRGYNGRLEYLKMELEVAREISGLETPNLLVYGGGDEIRKFCTDSSLVYVQDFINSKK